MPVSEIFCALMMLNPNNTNDPIPYLASQSLLRVSSPLSNSKRDWLNGDVAFTGELALTTLQFQWYCFSCSCGGTWSEKSASPRQSRGAVICVMHQKIGVWLLTGIKIPVENQGLVILSDIFFDCLVACHCGTVSAHLVLRSSRSSLIRSLCLSKECRAWKLGLSLHDP